MSILTNEIHVYMITYGLTVKDISGKVSYIPLLSNLCHLNDNSGNVELGYSLCPCSLSVLTNIVIVPCICLASRPAHHLSLWPSVCLSILNNDVTTLALKILDDSLEFGGMLHINIKHIHYSNALLGQFVCIQCRTFNFSMISFDQIWGTTLRFLICKCFSYWPEIWWDDAQYHEADHYLKRPCFINLFCIPQICFAFH